MSQWGLKFVSLLFAERWGPLSTANGEPPHRSLWQRTSRFRYSLCLRRFLLALGLRRFSRDEVSRTGLWVKGEREKTYSHQWRCGPNPLDRYCILQSEF